MEVNLVSVARIMQTPVATYISAELSNALAALGVLS